MLRATIVVTCLLAASPSGAQPKAPAPSAQNQTITQAPGPGSSGHARERPVAAGVEPQAALPEKPVLKPQPEPGPGDVSENAHQLFEQASRAFGEGRNADAIFLFQRANRLSPNSRFHYNIGLAYEDMGDPARALDAYRQYLRAETGQEDREDTTERIKQLQTQLVALGLQQITVMSEPEGAMLSIDGRAVGVTPWTGELELGAHEVHVHADEREAVSLQVWLDREDASEVGVSLRPIAHEPASVPSRDEEAPKEPPWLMKLQPATWTLAAAGTAAIAGGVLFEMLRAKDDGRLSGLSGVQADRVNRSAGVKQAASLTLLGTGAALWVASGVMAGFDLAGPSGYDRAASQSAGLQSVAGGAAPGLLEVRASGTF